MSGWREETRADLKDAEDRIVALIAEVSGEPTKGQVHSIWRAYLNVEKSVVFIKVEIDEENPGRFVKTKQYSVPDERQALQFALRNLRKGSESFALGDYVSSLRELREARNYLRLILRAKHRIKTKEAKASRIS
ncbi:MAG: hypothetical protein ABSB26_03080 [Nitrososphaerales archaeon]